MNTICLVILGILLEENKVRTNLCKIISLERQFIKIMGIIIWRSTAAAVPLRKHLAKKSELTIQFRTLLDFISGKGGLTGIG